MAVTSTITHDATTLSPIEILGYRSRREGGNLSHPVVGSEVVGITYRPAQLRTGSLTAVFTGEAESLAAENLLATGTEFTLDNAETLTIEMAFSVVGDITRELDMRTGFWHVGFGFQEVP